MRASVDVLRLFVPALGPRITQEIPAVACFVSVMLGCCRLIQRVPVLRQKISPGFFEFRRPRGLWDREALLQFETQPSTRWKAADLKGL